VKGDPFLDDGVRLVPIATGNAAFAQNDNHVCCNSNCRNPTSGLRVIASRSSNAKMVFL
jgi:hypothetical protein